MDARKTHFEEMIRGLFEMFDIDQSGEISMKEMKEALTKQFGGMEFSDEECQEMITKLDKDGNGQVKDIVVSYLQFPPCKTF